MVKTVQGDITEIEADVIINAANTENMHGGGVDMAIARAAGSKYKQASNETNGVPMGKFLVSPAGNLNAKVIIDVPTIDLNKGEIITLDALKAVWNDVLAYCQEKGYKTVATPLLGGGVVGYTKDQILPLLTKVAEQYNQLDVTIVIFSFS